MTWLNAWEIISPNGVAVFVGVCRAVADGMQSAWHLCDSHTSGAHHAQLALPRAATACGSGVYVCSHGIIHSLMCTNAIVFLLAAHPVKGWRHACFVRTSGSATLCTSIALHRSPPVETKSGLNDRRRSRRPTGMMQCITLLFMPCWLLCTLQTCVGQILLSKGCSFQLHIACASCRFGDQLALLQHQGTVEFHLVCSTSTTRSVVHTLKRAGRVTNYT